MIVNKLLYRISLNKARIWIMVFNCNINAFSNLTSIIYLYNENMKLEMIIKKLGSAYKLRVGRATGNKHIFCLVLSYVIRIVWHPYFFSSSDLSSIRSKDFHQHGRIGVKTSQLRHNIARISPNITTNLKKTKQI